MKLKNNHINKNQKNFSKNTLKKKIKKLKDLKVKLKRQPEAKANQKKQQLRKNKKKN